MQRLVHILNKSVRSFLAHDALSRAAAMAFYITTSLSPILLIVTAVASLMFDRDRVRAEITTELVGIVGPAGREFIAGLVSGGGDAASGSLASAFGLLLIILAVSGVFSEMQAALNTIWNAPPPSVPIAIWLRTRALSIGLVAALGFMLIASLVASTVLSVFQTRFENLLTGATVLFSVLNTVISLALFGALFAAIYKVLPDAPVPWREALIGGLLTGAMFTAGKSLIALYLAKAAPSSSYGAAGSLIILLLWTYYSSLIFLLGAEITQALYAGDGEAKNATAFRHPETG